MIPREIINLILSYTTDQIFLNCLLSAKYFHVNYEKNCQNRKYKKMQIIPYVGHQFWVPLSFWFSRNPELAIPMVHIPYHEVKIKIEHKKL